MAQASPRRPNAATGSVALEAWSFFGVTFAITWSCWLSIVAFGIRTDEPLALALLLAGLTGPGIAGVGFVYRTYDERGRSDFWSRVTGVRRIGVGWFVVLLSLPLIVVLAAGSIDALLGGAGATPGEWVREFAETPLAIAPALFFATLPPILEELGWRGYALDRLQLTRSALGASVILGIVWSIWHLPLFLIPGTYQHDTVGLGTAEFWLFLIGIVPLSVVITWVYNNTARSVLAAILLHGMVNFAGEAIEIAQRAEIVFVLCWILVAVLVTAIWGAKTLTGSRPIPRPPPRRDREL
jgi:uncharacterized protein